MIKVQWWSLVNKSNTTDNWLLLLLSRSSNGNSTCFRLVIKFLGISISPFITKITTICWKYSMMSILLASPSCRPKLFLATNKIPLSWGLILKIEKKKMSMLSCLDFGHKNSNFILNVCSFWLRKELIILKEESQ